MADFSTFRSRRRAYERGSGLIDRILAAYSAAAGVRDELALYQAGTDAELLAAVNVVFTPQQRAEIAQIAGLLAGFATDMETHHPSITALL